jgi:hypothetical protein
MPDELQRGSEAESADYDAFFLGPLQAIRGDGAWYLNHRFIGKGGNGTHSLLAAHQVRIMVFNLR